MDDIRLLMPHTEANDCPRCQLLIDRMSAAGMLVVNPEDNRYVMPTTFGYEVVGYFLGMMSEHAEDDNDMPDSLRTAIGVTGEMCDAIGRSGGPNGAPSAN